MSRGEWTGFHLQKIYAHVVLRPEMPNQEQSGKLLMEGVVRVTLQRILMLSQYHLAVYISLVSCKAALHTVTPLALSLAQGQLSVSQQHST